MKNLLFALLFTLSALLAHAQAANYSYDNKIYVPYIKTVECYNSTKEQSFPIIRLNSHETITLGFDDLQGSSKNYSYTVEHCTFDWQPSRINVLDYLETFREDIIFDYKYSVNTLQRFTHYQLKLPNEQIKPKIAGNYLLKIYESGKADKPIITQRFYLVSNSLNVGVEIVPATNVQHRNTKQKINLTVFNPFNIQSPNTDLKVVVMQNGIPYSQKINTKPQFIRPNSIAYTDLNANEFWGGNEFRKFDTRSFRYKATGVQQSYRDSLQNIVLSTDLPADANRYSNSLDENGAFYIRNNDGRNHITDSDYANVKFTLNAQPPKSNGHVYVVGRFNNYTFSDENKLSYVAAQQRFYGNIMLKQGIYDYKYIWVDENGIINDTVFEGSFFETSNSYQVLVYYRKPATRYDELAGFSMVNSAKR